MTRLGIGLASCIALTSTALAAPAPDLCPVSPLHQSLGIILWESDQSPQPNGTLVRCEYRATRGLDVGGKEIGFNPLCPSGKKIAFPGWTLT